MPLYYAGPVVGSAEVAHCHSGVLGPACLYCRAARTRGGYHGLQREWLCLREAEGLQDMQTYGALSHICLQRQS
jgi:hypothetical protein